MHHVHLWSLSSEINPLDVHAYSCERDTARTEKMKRGIKTRLDRHGLLHPTLECECDECRECLLGGSAARHGRVRGDRRPGRRRRRPPGAAFPGTMGPDPASLLQHHRTTHRDLRSFFYPEPCTDGGVDSPIECRF